MDYFTSSVGIFHCRTDVRECSIKVRRSIVFPIFIYVPALFFKTVPSTVIFFMIVSLTKYELLHIKIHFVQFNSQHSTIAIMQRNIYLGRSSKNNNAFRYYALCICRIMYLFYRQRVMLLALMHYLSLSRGTMRVKLLYKYIYIFLRPSYSVLILFSLLFIFLYFAMYAVYVLERFLRTITYAWSRRHICYSTVYFTACL